jgi:hypothetical protein
MIPTIPAYIVGEHAEVFCPWCGTIHLHGVTPGGRLSHCRIGGGEYILAPTPSPMPEELRRAAAVNRRRLTRYLDRGGTYEPILPELGEATVGLQREGTQHA